MRPSQGFGGTGAGKQGNVGQILRERGTKTMLGNREHKKTNFLFGGTSQFISGILGNGYPQGRVSFIPSRTFHIPVLSFPKFQK